MESAAPLYRKVKDFIVQRVTEGAWAAGSRVPSENELTSEFRVSRMTVNRALRELTDEGWLKRVQGAGTFIAEQKPQSALLEIRNIRDEIAERGHRHSAEVLELRSEAASAEAAHALALRRGQRVFHSLLLHLEEGRPIQLEERFVNPAFAPDYLKQDFTRTTPYEYLMACGPIDAAEHIIEAVAPDAAIRRLLGLRAASPCLRLTRRTWSQNLVATQARLTYPDAYRLVGRQELGARPGARKTHKGELP